MPEPQRQEACAGDTRSAVSDTVASIDQEFKNAPRLQTSLLAPIERACLKWIAGRLPDFIKPDHLTLVGFIAMMMAGASYGLAPWWPPALLAVNLWIAVNWFGDSLDGTLARARGKQRPRYGFYVDHIVDAFGTLFLVIGLAASGYVSLAVALALLVVYFLLSIDVYLATYTMGAFRLSFWKFGPTELRVVLALANLRAFADRDVSILGVKYLFFDVTAVIAMAAMMTVIIISVARNTITLYRSERV